MCVLSSSAQPDWKPACTDVAAAPGDAKKTSREVCTFGELKSVRTATSNEKGHFHYTYELFRRHADGSYLAIRVTDLLQSNQDRLLENINRKIGLDYIELLEDPLTAKCILKPEAPQFTFDGLGFFFDEFGYHFRAHFDVQQDCEPVDASTVSFTPEKMKRYLKR